MPLPKINTPTYELSLPSNGKKIKYRPFLVREEKILIMALETEDQKQITAAIIQILTACIMTRGVKLNELATFDIEYLFLNVRSLSPVCLVPPIKPGITIGYHKYDLILVR